MTNSIDPAASDQGLHCLLRHVNPNTRVMNVLFELFAFCSQFYFNRKRSNCKENAALEKKKFTCLC